MKADFGVDVIVSAAAPLPTTREELLRVRTELLLGLSLLIQLVKQVVSPATAWQGLPERRMTLEHDGHEHTERTASRVIYS